MHTVTLGCPIVRDSKTAQLRIRRAVNPRHL
jgi:hypothetical protein